MKKFAILVSILAAASFAFAAANTPEVIDLGKSLM